MNDINESSTTKNVAVYLMDSPENKGVKPRDKKGLSF
jgi:hypothetical protein